MKKYNRNMNNLVVSEVIENMINHVEYSRDRRIPYAIHEMDIYECSEYINNCIEEDYQMVLEDISYNGDYYNECFYYES